MRRPAVAAVACGAALGVAWVARKRWRSYNARAMAFFHERMNSADFAADVARVRAYAAARRRDFEAAGAPAASFPRAVDLVVSGGGFKVCYAGGVHIALGDMGVETARFAGASAGAQVGYCMYANDHDAALTWALSVAATTEAFPFAFPGPMWDRFYRAKAREHGVPEPGRLVVSITRVTATLLGVLPTAGESTLIDAFRDADDVGDALIATANVPYLMTAAPAMPFRGAGALDGGLTNNCPHFTDGARPQVVVTWDDLEEGLRARTAGLYLTGDEMVALATRGIDAAYALARGEPARCVALVDADLNGLPAACRRSADSVDLLGIAYAAAETYLAPLEKRAVRRAGRGAPG